MVAYVILVIYLLLQWQLLVFLLSLLRNLMALYSNVAFHLNDLLHKCI